MGAISHSIARTTIRHLRSNSIRSLVSPSNRSTELLDRYTPVPLGRSLGVSAPNAAQYLEPIRQSKLRFCCEVTGSKPSQLTVSRSGILVDTQQQGLFYAPPQSRFIENIGLRSGHSRRITTMASSSPASTSGSKVEDANPFQGKVSLSAGRLSSPTICFVSKLGIRIRSTIGASLSLCLYMYTISGNKFMEINYTRLACIVENHWLTT